MKANKKKIPFTTLEVSAVGLSGLALTALVVSPFFFVPVAAITLAVAALTDVKSGSLPERSWGLLNRQSNAAPAPKS